MNHAEWINDWMAGATHSNSWRTAAGSSDNQNIALLQEVTARFEQFAQS
jgi:hypothetical protein